jgi:hypothetical protein
MRRMAFFPVAIATLASVFTYIVHASGQAHENSAPAYVTKIPSGYRDWRWISSAHEAGNLNSIGAVLGNDVAIKAYRDGKLPFPDGAIIAALHYRYVPSEENNEVFGQAQSFVPGPPTNIQFMVKDSKKYAATGGWQTWRRGVYEKLLPLPREGQSDRLCLYSLCTLMLKVRKE